MRTSIIFALVAVAFTAVLAAPAPHVINAKQIQPTIQKNLPRGLIADLEKIVEQAKVTVKEVRDALQDGVDRLRPIIEEQAPALVAELEQVVQETEKRFQKIVDSLSAITIGTPVEKIVEILEQAGKDIVTLVDDTVERVQQVIENTSASLQQQVQPIVDETVAEVRRSIDALVKVIKDVLSPNTKASTIGEIIAEAEKAVKKIREAVREAIDAAKAVLQGEAQETIAKVEAVLQQAIDQAEQVIRDAIKAAAGTTLEDLAALVQKALADVDQIVKNAQADLEAIIADVSESVRPELRAILQKAIDEIKVAAKEFVDFITSLSRKTARGPIEDFIGKVKAALERIGNALEGARDQLVAAVQGTNVVDQVEAALDNAVEKVKEIARAVPAAILANPAQAVEILKQARDDIVAEVRSTASQLEAIVATASESIREEVQRILRETVDEIESAIDDLLTSLRPESKAATNGLLEQLIQLIGLSLGIDVKAIVAQVPVTIEGVEAALTEGAQDILALIEDADAQTAAEMNAIIEDAVKKATEILTPLYEVLKPFIPNTQTKALSHTITPNDLLDNLLELIIGMNLEELKALVNLTVAELEQLVRDTIKRIETFINDYSTQLGQQAEAIVEKTIGKVDAAVEPLIDLLRPLFPPPTKAIAQENPLLELLIKLIEQALGIDVSDIIDQAKLTAEGIEAAVGAANAELEQLLESSTILQEVEAIEAEARAEVKAILDRLVAKVLSGITLEKLKEEVQKTINELTALAESTISRIQEVVQGGAAEIADKVRGVLRQLVLDCRAQLEPLIELLKPLIPTPVKRIH